MNRDVKGIKDLLRSVVTAVIVCDNLSRALDDTYRSSRKIKKDEDIEDLRKLIDEALRNLHLERAMIARVRLKAEIITWQGQQHCPHLDRLVDDLELSECAKGCIPEGMSTIRQLCALKASELFSPEGMYINEIKDGLLQFGLVLRPDEK